MGNSAWDLFVVIWAELVLQFSLSLFKLFCYFCPRFMTVPSYWSVYECFVYVCVYTLNDAMLLMPYCIYFSQTCWFCLAWVDTLKKIKLGMSVFKFLSFFFKSVKGPVLIPLPRWHSVNCNSFSSLTVCVSDFSLE